MGPLSLDIFDDNFFPEEIVLGEVNPQLSDMESSPNPDYKTNTLLTTTTEPDFSNPYLQVVKFTPEGTVYSINGTVIEVVESDPEKDSGKIVPAGLNYTYTMYDEDGLPTSTTEVPLYSIVPSRNNVTVHPPSVGITNGGPSRGETGEGRTGKSSGTTSAGGTITATPTAAAATAKATKIYEDGAELLSARSSYLSLAIAVAIGFGFLMA